MQWVHVGLIEVFISIKSIIKSPIINVLSVGDNDYIF